MGLFDSFKKVAKGAATPPSSPRATVAGPVVAERDQQNGSISPVTTREPRKRILFINTAPAWRESIEAKFVALEPSWSCETVENLSLAAASLAKGSCFAVIVGGATAVDANLPALFSGQPAAQARFVLVESKDTTLLARWGSAGMQTLPASIDAAGLRAEINRVVRVQEWLGDAGMKKLLLQCRKLPVMSKLYSEISEELNSPNGSVEKVALHVAKDPVMTAKILQVVNSANFALGRPITDPAEAVMFLGMGRTRALVLMLSTFSQFDNLTYCGHTLEQIWNHSLQVANLAQIIAANETKDRKLAEAAFTSGLMHDIGKLVLAVNVPTMCASVERLCENPTLSRRAAETQVFGTTHAELAACLLGTWGLPLPILEAVAWHHSPNRSEDKSFSALTAVHAANVFAYESGYGNKTTPEAFDLDYLADIGAGERRNSWREECGLPVRAEEDAAYQRIRLRRESKRN